MELFLVKASEKYADQIMDYKKEFIYNNDSMDGTGKLRSSNSPEEYLEWCRKFSSESLCPEGIVPSTQYFAVVDGKLVGMLDFRHHINHPILSKIGGHIGYSVRPSERQKGYASEMLRLALDEIRKFGLSKVLITCLVDNIASEKIIIKNGGVFEGTATDGNETVKRYWIEL